MSTSQPGFEGWVIEVKSFTELIGHVFVQPTSIIRYGALVEVEDSASKRRYLAVVVNVSESFSIASIDPQALKNMLNNIVSQQAQYRSLSQLLKQLLGSGLINNLGVREVELRLLGVIDAANARLLSVEEPPRPASTIKSPDPNLLQRIVAGGIGGSGLEIGELLYNSSVKAYLDPGKLTTHLAVLGQTGAGKSETVKRLVAEYMWRKHIFSRGGGVVVFDVAGEYVGYPYHRRQNAIPLLDAALDPNSFPNARIVKSMSGSLWVESAGKTILVPYDLYILPLRGGTRGEEAYAATIASFVDYLKNRYSGRDVVGLLYARHHVYRIDGSNNIAVISRSDAAQIISNNNVLLVAAIPLPDMLPVSEIVELSHSHSQYFEPALVEVADALGLLEVDNVLVPLSLIVLLRAAHQLQNRMGQGQRRGTGASTNVVDSLVNAVRNAINRINNGTDPQSAVGRMLQAIGIRPYSVYMRALLNLFALPTLLSDPGADVYNVSVVQQALSNNNFVPGTAWSDFLVDGIRHALNSFMSYDARTRMSIIRGFQRVERLVSPWLDPKQYELLAQRAVEGFTIVQLAEPSRGDTDLVVGMLLEELFYASHRGYSPERKTLIVIEEAHNLAPADVDKVSKRALLRIAREGRKWGLSLVLVSQRPGFIDEDILSQAATVVAMRITNPNDLSSLKRSIESVSQDMVDRLPDLEPGQAIISGPAVPERRIPLLVKVRQLLPQPPSQQGASASSGQSSAGGSLPGSKASP